MAALASSSTSDGSAPASSMAPTRRMASASSMPTMASVSSFDMPTSLDHERPARRLVSLYHIMYRYLVEGKRRPGPLI